MKSIFDSFSDFLKYFKLEKKLINYNSDYTKISKGTLRDRNIVWARLLLNDLIYCKLVEGKLIHNSNYQGRNLKLYFRKNINILSINYFNKLINKRYFDKFSYHFDFSRKVYLFKKLKKLNRNSKLLFPECGLIGFDMIIAHKLGFKNIMGYDLQKNCKTSVNKIWGINLKIESSNTKNYNFKNNEYIVIKPDWPSEYFNEKFKNAKKILKYSNKDNFGDHFKKLKLVDFTQFIKIF